MPLHDSVYRYRQLHMYVYICLYIDIFRHIYVRLYISNVAFQPAAAHRDTQGVLLRSGMAKERP